MQMNDADHRAMYRYIYSFRAKGNPAPDRAPPATQVKTPYIEFAQNLPISGTVK